MDKKLTLSIDKSIIERAKQYAEKNNISLSKLIESYLSALTVKSKKDNKITPLVKSISGVIEDSESNDYIDFLTEKYK